MHFILNELRLKFNQLSSIMLFKALSLFTRRFDPILYLAQLLTRNLVDLPLIDSTIWKRAKRMPDIIVETTKTHFVKKLTQLFLASSKMSIPANLPRMKNMAYSHLNPFSETSTFWQINFFDNATKFKVYRILFKLMTHCVLMFNVSRCCMN